jgi:TM2 domain-containing membrane protein YozV/Tfp pilus assembly major pilin PilA
MSAVRRVAIHQALQGQNGSRLAWHLPRGFGAHRFYLGQWWGLFYLLFFWLWIPGIVALIEGIVFLCTDERKWNDRHNDGRSSSSGSGAGVVIAIVVSVFVVIAMIGILAAVAIPAYQDYTTKAKVAQAYFEANEAATEVANYAVRTRSIPATVRDAGYIKVLHPSIQSMDIDGRTAVIHVTMADGAIRGKSFFLQPVFQKDSTIQWECSSEDIEPRLLPSACR